MNLSRHNQYLDLDDKALHEIHLRSEEFEAALSKSSASSRIESCLENSPAAIRSPLFQELLAIEIHWLEASGYQPLPNLYLSRFPAFESEVARVFRDLHDTANFQGSDSQLPVGGQHSSLRMTNLASGSVIADRYTLVEPIGEGGMGTVFLAEQSEPLKRQVALKVIKGGMDTKAVVARFNIERQSLALMDHPHIARVYDGGTTDDGQPFFVMELVHGLPVTQYCDHERLSVISRLKLVALIGKAVQHAHTKGIIHRDLKPANILVSTVDGQAVPKIIDFGVAKAMEQPLVEQRVDATAAIVGTPAYMAPEQAIPSSTGVDMRADVFSLGVVLYELLVGSLPHQLQKTEEGAVAEMLRMVRDSDSPRPSSRLSNVASLSTIAKNRSTQPNLLAVLLKTDLDWIVLKALQRDRDRRYETVNALVRDIERYLAGEMIEARPPSTSYRLKKLFQRYRLQTVAAGLVFLSLLAGVIGTGLAMLEAQKQFNAAREETAKVELAKEEEAQQRGFAEAIAEFVEFDILAMTSLEGRLDFGGTTAGLDIDSTLQDVLDRAAKTLNQRTDLDPRIEARLRSMIGRSQRGVGDYPQAIASYQRSIELNFNAYGSEDKRTLAAQEGLVQALQENGQYEAAEAILETLVPKNELLFGVESPQSLGSKQLLAKNLRKTGHVQEAIDILQSTVKSFTKTEGPEAHNTLTNMHDLVLAYDAADLRTEARSLLDKTLELQTKVLGEDHPDTNASLLILADFHRRSGKFDEALPILEKKLAWTKKQRGTKAHDTLIAMGAIAVCYRDMKKLDLAIPMFIESLALAEKILEPQHPDITNARNSLAITYWSAGEFEQALSLFEQTLEYRMSVFGEDHPQTILNLTNLAACLRGLGSIEEALDLDKKALASANEVFGPDHRNTLAIMQNLAVGFWKLKKLDRSVPLFEKVFAAHEAKFGRDNIITLATMRNLGVNYRDAGRFEDSIALLEEVGASSNSTLAVNGSGFELLDAYYQAAKTNQGQELLGKLLLEIHEKDAGNQAQLKSRLALLGTILVRSHATAEAEPLLREYLSLVDQADPMSWKDYDVMALLGETLLEKEEFQESEQLLLAGYEGMKRTASSAPLKSRERMLVVIQRIIELYTALEQPEDVDRWQAARTTFLPPSAKQ